MTTASSLPNAADATSPAHSPAVAAVGAQLRFAAAHYSAAGEVSPLPGVDLNWDGFNPLSAVAARLIPNANVVITGRPATGKTHLARGCVQAAIGDGDTVVIAGDPKGDYRGVCDERDDWGRHIPITPTTPINPMAVGGLDGLTAAVDAAGDTDRADRLRADLCHYRVTTVCALMELYRDRRLDPDEYAELDASVTNLDGRGPNGRAWALTDVADDLRAHAHLRSHAVDLADDIDAMTRGPWGAVFGQAGGDTPIIDCDLAVILFDTSIVAATTEPRLRAAITIAVWAAAFGAVQAEHHQRAAHQQHPQRFMVVLDEADAVTRFPYTADRIVNLCAVPDHSTRYRTAVMTVAHRVTEATAVLADRSATVFIGPLAAADRARLADVLALSDDHRELLAAYETHDEHAHHHAFASRQLFWRAPHHRDDTGFWVRAARTTEGAR